MEPLDLAFGPGALTTFRSQDLSHAALRLGVEKLSYVASQAGSKEKQWWWWPDAGTGFLGPELGNSSQPLHNVVDYCVNETSMILCSGSQKQFQLL